MFAQLAGNACGFGALSDAPIGSTIGGSDATLANAQAAIFQARNYPDLIAHNAALSSALNAMLAQFGTGHNEGWGAGTGQAQYIDEIRQRTAQILSYLPGGANYVPYTPPPPPVYTPPVTPGDSIYISPPQPGPGEEYTPPPTNGHISPPVYVPPTPPIDTPPPVDVTPPGGMVIYTPPVDPPTTGSIYTAPVTTPPVSITPPVSTVPPGTQDQPQPISITGDQPMTTASTMLGGLDPKILLIGAAIAAFFLLGKK